MDMRNERFAGVAYPDTWFTRDQIMALCGVSRWAPTEWGRRGLLARRPIEGKAYLYAVHGAITVALLRQSNRVELLGALANKRGVEIGAPYEPDAAPLDAVINAQRVERAFESPPAPSEEEAAAAAREQAAAEEEEARASAAPFTDDERGVFALFSARGWRDLSRAQVARVVGVREELAGRIGEEEARAWIVAKLDKIAKRGARYHAGAVVSFLELDAPDALAAPAAAPPRRAEEERRPLSPAQLSRSTLCAARAILSIIARGADEIAQITQLEKRERDGRDVIVFSCRSATYRGADGVPHVFTTSLAAWESTVLKGAHHAPLRLEFFKRAARARAEELPEWAGADQATVEAQIAQLAALWIKTAEEEGAR